jgi:hypothetical protein
MDGTSQPANPRELYWIGPARDEDRGRDAALTRRIGDCSAVVAGAGRDNLAHSRGFHALAECVDSTAHFEGSSREVAFELKINAESLGKVDAGRREHPRETAAGVGNGIGSDHFGSQRMILADRVDWIVYAIAPGIARYGVALPVLLYVREAQRVEGA